MKVLGVLTTAIVFLVLASRMPAYSQERDDAKQDQTQEEKDKAKNNDKDKARQQDNARRPDDKASRPDEKAGRQDEHSQPQANRPQEQRQGQRAEQRTEQGQEQHTEQGQVQRSEGQRGRHIDDDKFRASFGHQHTFHVERTRIVNSPQPVVVYGGYQFKLVDAWPADWGYDDDVYVDYIDGEYFLFNARHPGIRIAVFVLD